MIGSREHPSGINVRIVFECGYDATQGDRDLLLCSSKQMEESWLDQSTRDRLLRQLDPLAKAAENDTEQALWEPYEQHGLKLNIINSTNHIPR